MCILLLKLQPTLVSPSLILTTTTAVYCGNYDLCFIDEGMDAQGFKVVCPMPQRDGPNNQASHSQFCVLSTTLHSIFSCISSLAPTNPTNPLSHMRNERLWDGACNDRSKLKQVSSNCSSQIPEKWNVYH